MQKNKRLGWLLIMVQVCLSFFKDDLTPDYLNTANAWFLNPAWSGHHGTFSTLGTHPAFWLMALLYSGLFVLLPSGIMYLWFGKLEARYTLMILTGIFVLEYVLVFSGSSVAVTHILPKVNRYFHAPILTLFLVVAFQLNQRKHESD